MLKYLDQGAIVVDTKANVRLYSEPVTEIAGISQDEIIGKNILDIFKSLTPETSTFYYVLKNKEPLIDKVQTYTNYKGEWKTTVTSTVPIIVNNKILGALEIFRQVDDVKELSEKVLAHHKKLTDKKNNKYDKARFTFDDIIGESDEIKDLVKRAKKMSNSSSPIFIYGETGTGKEVFAHAIHNDNLDRWDRPFIAQNCAAMPKDLCETILFGTVEGSFTGARDEPGIIEMANGGTLFLDEINSMDIDLQGKLLRVLQDGILRRVGGNNPIKVDVRFVAATNEHPYISIKKKKLREDLFYRLNVLSLEIPPLRKRKEDIPILIDRFIKDFNEKLNKNVEGISLQALYIFKNNYWPGNIRELKHTIESIMHFIENKCIEVSDLPQDMFTQTYFPEEEIDSRNNNILSLSESLRNYEITLINTAIKDADGNYTKAAKLLNIPKQTLHNKIKKFGII